MIGNGNAAGQHALALSEIADKVLLVCPDAKFMADAAHRQLIEQKDNISQLLGMEVIEFKGLNFVEALVVSTEQGKKKDIAVDGAFMAFGWKPITDMLAIEVDKTEEGYLKTDDNLMTSFPGLFAAGDVRDTDLFQVITSCADGARAAMYAMEFLKGL